MAAKMAVKMAAIFIENARTPLKAAKTCFNSALLTAYLSISYTHIATAQKGTN